MGAILGMGGEGSGIGWRKKLSCDDALDSSFGYFYGSGRFELGRFCRVVLCRVKAVRFLYVYIGIWI